MVSKKIGGKSNSPGRIKGNGGIVNAAVNYDRLAGK